jgi:dethiobiotin synthetase
VPGVLVTGTDTGVGKTRVATSLVGLLRARGHSVGVCKPCETGVAAPWPPADAAAELPAGSDAAALAAAAGSTDDVRDVLPVAYPLPAAPEVAARQVGETIDVDAIAAAYERLAAQHDIVVVEGAGGLLVPITPGFTFADLAARLSLPLVIVARTALGTLNHTALTERAAFAAGLEVLGVVLNSPDAEPDTADEANLAALEGLLSSPVLARLPHGTGPERGGDLTALVEAVAALVG